jgi:hypothetical protein
VTVRCPCRRQKKEWPCTDVRAAQSKSRNQGLELLTCDKDCKRLAEQRRAHEAAAAKKVGDKPQEKESPKKPEEGLSKGRRRGGRRRDEENLETQQVRAHALVERNILRGCWLELLLHFSSEAVAEDLVSSNLKQIKSIRNWKFLQSGFN